MPDYESGVKKIFLHFVPYYQALFPGKVKEMQFNDAQVFYNRASPYGRYLFIPPFLRICTDS